MIHKVFSFIHKIYIEAIIVLLLVLCVTIFLGQPKNRIYSDGMGYYEYLPSIFIFHDINRKDTPLKDSSALYKRFENIRFYKEYKGYKVNKFSCGTAILQAPFFLITYAAFDLEHTYKDGYQQIFQKTMYVSVLFYLFIMLCFLRALLQLYEINKPIIVYSQLILVFATSVIVYTNLEAAFSHIYSLCIITIFLYVTKKYFLYKNKNLILIACILFGLILLLRQVNFLVLLFIPFIAGSWKNLKDGIASLYKELPTLLLGIICVVAIFSIQSLFWYLQTGDFILYSYKGETFDFTNPQFINILFSYRKGLFVYAPIFLLSIVAIGWIAYVRNFYFVLTWLTAFLLLTYVLCSWWSWYYGGSYGLRAYIDYYTLFLIPIAIFVQQLKPALKICVAVFSMCTIVLNMIQTYQYKEHILHTDKMDKESYWNLFLKTDDEYKFFLWNRMISDNEYTLLKEYKVDQQIGNKIIFIKSLSEIPNVKSLDVIQITMENDFDVDDKSRIEISIIDTITGKCVFFNNPPIIHFAQHGFNRKQEGIYNCNLTRDYKIRLLNEGNALVLKLEILNEKKNITNVHVRFYISKVPQENIESKNQ